MTSTTSGYITVRKTNGSDKYPYYWSKIIDVPVNHSVMVSYKGATTRSYSAVKLYEIPEHTKDLREIKDPHLVWDRYRDIASDFAYTTSGTNLVVKVYRDFCPNTACFRLFFTFFPMGKGPRRTPGGLLNCSLEDFSSFEHHVACNLHTECEDGRDETEHCPFSSPDCQGMVAFCNRCYKVIRSRKYSTFDIAKKGKELCNSLGGMLGLPVCGHNWCSILQNIKRLHDTWKPPQYFGLYSRDVSSPALYTNGLITADKTVLYHSFKIPFNLYSDGDRKCYSSHVCARYILCFNCEDKLWLQEVAIICEFKTNTTYPLKAISMTSTRFLSPAEPSPVTRCGEGHVTYTFLSCGRSVHSVCGQHHTPCRIATALSDVSASNPLDHQDTLIPTFTCRETFTTLSYTLVCNVIADCEDESDETFCHHPLCIKQFTCHNGQCVVYDKVCDLLPNCHDQSEEHNCAAVQEFSRKSTFLSSPVLICFDGISQFISTPMNSSEPCPDSHYRCPGELNDCLPVYTRCNGMYDCVDHQDERGCEDMTCPGFFRCRASTTCVYSNHICDGWPHCPMLDDELVCHVMCPGGCRCQGHAFLCHHTFSSALFPGLRFLDGTGSGLTLSDVTDNDYLLHLILAQCSLTRLPAVKLLNLMFLDLRANALQHVNGTAFLGLSNLQVLSLSNNPLTSINSDLSSSGHQSALRVLDLSFTKLTVLDTQFFLPFPHLQKLNLTFTLTHTISPDVFQFTRTLVELYMDGSPIIGFSSDVFKGLSKLQIIHAANYKFCCKVILPYSFDESSCYAPKDEISSCEDLLQSWTYRGFLWLVSCLSLTGNVFCFCARLYAKRTISSKSGFSVFVTNLIVADFLMGVYIAIIGVVDETFRGRYLHHDDVWKNSVTCKVAGFLSLMSSEVSALIICLITLDRFVVLRFPFSTLRFEKTSAAMTCLSTWLVGWFLALLPLLPMTSHWEFYSQTGICIPLPVTRQQFKGKMYSFSVLIVFNFTLFLLICSGQIIIYWSIQSNAMKRDTTKASRDITIARRLFSVAATDFMCWFPIGLCGMLALTDTPIPGEVSAALAIFVLPLNSAINPFMYTFNTLAQKREQVNEAKFLKWLEANAEVLNG